MRTRTALATGGVALGMLLAGATPAVASHPDDRPRARPTEATWSPRPKPTASPSPTSTPPPTAVPSPTGTPTPTGSPTPTTPAPMPTADRTAVVLPSLDGLSTSASDVNGQGVVAGAARLASGYWHAVRWVDGRIEDLGTLGGLNSQAEAIDEQGRIVGTSQDAEGRSHAVAWVDGRIQDLGLTGGIFSIAYDTAGDRVVGVYHITDSFSGRRAFVRTGDTEVTIDVPPGANATAVNDAGMVAGTYGWQDWDDPAPDDYQAFVWQDGLTRPLGTLGGATSTANGINDLGQVVGTSWTTDGVFAAFFWDGSSMRRLATTAVSPTAQAVNDSGLVIGTEGHGDRAMIWPDPSATSQLLPLPSGAVGSRAINVNDQGLIVGQADYLSPNWHGRAVVWR
ncbi:hypothetical protein [Micromonospora fulviviridis]|uniref:HAF repeat-containing protein n=1 Tax=Micromonospora fulviviridis TaxID=47860 RepID=A0ABV2VP17_9ACTN